MIVCRWAALIRDVVCCLLCAADMPPPPARLPSSSSAAASASAPAAAAASASASAAASASASASAAAAAAAAATSAATAALGSTKRLTPAQNEKLRQSIGLWTSKLTDQLAVECKFKKAKPARGLNLGNRSHFSSALDFFALILTEEILASIVSATNQCGRSKESEQQPWQDTDVREMKALFGCIMYMGLVHLPDLDMYWKESSPVDFVTSRFPRNRFRQLYFALSTSTTHASTAAAESKKNLSAILPFTRALNKRFSSLLVPGSNLCVDETMIKFRGTHTAIQSMPKKPIRIGFKCWALATTDGYMLNLDLYGGKESEPSEVSCL